MLFTHCNYLICMNENLSKFIKKNPNNLITSKFISSSMNQSYVISWILVYKILIHTAHYKKVQQIPLNN